MRRWQTPASDSLTGRTATSLAGGLLAGAVAGVVTAIADFGAQWLWLDDWNDRGTLLLRLAGTQAPAGALAGALLGAVAASGRDTRRRALALTLLATPWLAWIASLLFTGGSASRLPWRTGLGLLTACVLVVGCAATLYAGLRLLARARADRTQVLRIAIGFAFAGLAADKLDQHVLPNLYLYLHAALAATSWLAYTACALACASAFGRPAPRRLALAASVAAVALGSVAAWSTRSLDDNQNVLVALHGPRAAHSASLMRALAPLLADPRPPGPRRDVRARQTRARERVRGAGPVFENAHILLVTVDALRADHLGSYGYERPTSPGLDALAARAVVFERAYTQAPHSSFALGSLHASEYLHETIELGQPAPEETLASVLAKAGYHTAAFYTSGIFHTAAAGLARYERDAFGFAFYDRTDRPAEATTDRVLEEVDRTVARGEPNSLFWVHYFDVHEPYGPTTFGTSDLDRYDSEIRAVDGAVVRLVAEVRRRLSRDVVVAFTADHGEEFREHGGIYHGSSLYEEQVRVPLWLDVPGIPPRRVASPVESVDLVPTLLELVGIPAATTMRGNDLRPQLLGSDVPPEPAFSAVIHKRMVVRWPHKLIADLRFGLYELYDLSRDPAERTNLADDEPALRAALTDEVYAWLDELATTSTAPADTLRAALGRGRLADRRATEPLARLVADEHAPHEQRRDAARLLGRLADPEAKGGLLVALAASDAWVAAEAAIALGRMYDESARGALRKLVESEDADLRSRAAVSLGRLRDRHAVPALIDALWIAPDLYEREEAVRWLGRLRDNRALEPLIALLPELRTRPLVVIAMGHIGDSRAYGPLVDVLRWEHHPNVRDNVVRGLGLLGDPRAIDVILSLAVEDPALENASESLVRLGAIESGAIGGADFAREQPGSRGLGRCQVGPSLHDWNYLQRTTCETRRGHASFLLEVPPSAQGAAGGVVATLGVRRIDAQAPAELCLAIDGEELAPVRVDGSWAEYRWDIAPERLARKPMRAEVHGVDPEARFALDHLLLLPRAQVLAAAIQR